MRRLPIALAVLAAALVLAPAADAKGTLAHVQVCGPTGCDAVTAKAARHALSIAIFDQARGVPVAPLGPYYELRTSPQLSGIYVLPSAGTLVANGSWRALRGPALAAVRSAAAGVAPYRPRLGSVSVGARFVRDPARYASLFDHLAVAKDAPYAVWSRAHVDISAGFTRATPWSGLESFRFEPRSGLLLGAEGRWVRPPTALAARIRADAAASRRATAPAAVTEPRKGGGGRRVAMASAAALAVGVAALGMVRRRRRNGGGGAA